MLNIDACLFDKYMKLNIMPRLLRRTILIFNVDGL
jgi:hypothetical protein